MIGSDVLHELESLVDSYDAEFQVEVGSMSAWSGTLRVTVTNPDDAPSRSITFYRTGRGTPEDVARDLIADFKRWRTEGEATPMPVPDWLKGKEPEDRPGSSCCGAAMTVRSDAGASYGVCTACGQPADGHA